MRRQEVEVLKRIFHGLVPLPWLLGTLLFINGALDRSPPQNFQTTVVSRFAMPGLLPMHQLIVTSWRDDGLERLAVTRQDFDLCPQWRRRRSARAIGLGRYPLDLRRLQQIEVLQAQRRIRGLTVRRTFFPLLLSF